MSKKILILIGYAIALLVAEKIFNFATQNISVFHYGKYDVYQTSATSGTGIIVLIRYVLLFCSACMIIRSSSISSRVKNAVFLFSLSSFLFNILEYRFAVIGRMEILLMANYILFFSTVIRQTGLMRRANIGKCYVSLTGILCVGFLLLRALMTFRAYFREESELTNYHFFLPF